MIGIYYKFKLAGSEQLQLLSEPFAFPDPDRKEGCRWIAVAGDDPFTLPIDRSVFAMLKEQAPALK